jgi:hypothetical protein
MVTVKRENSDIFDGAPRVKQQKGVVVTRQFHISDCLGTMNSR